MHRLRFLLLLSLMFAVGGTVVARAQAGDQDQSDTKVTTKATKVKDTSGHQNHWYSPPHWFHRKHNTEAKNAKPASKSLESKPQPAANSASTSKPALVTKSGSRNAAATSSSHKTATGMVTGTKTASATGVHKKSVAGAGRRRTTGAGKTTAKSSCTPEQAKKTGCTVNKSPTQRGTTSASAVKPS
jgi:hypothetical protein